MLGRKHAVGAAGPHFHRAEAHFGNQGQVLLQGQRAGEAQGPQALIGPQQALEQQFRRALLKDFGIVFNRRFAITNIPVSRFLNYLIESGNYAGYMEKLVNTFNPVAATGVVCRDTISVG